jgi:hypothetical protein
MSVKTVAAIFLESSLSVYITRKIVCTSAPTAQAAITDYVPST